MKRGKHSALWLSFILLLSTLSACTKLLGDFTIGAGGDAGTNHVDPDSGPQTGPIVVDPSGGLYTSEMGGKASFTIVLKTRPKANVSVALSSSNPNEGTVSPAMVTFTPDNFAAPQMVTVTGVDDKAPDGNQAYKIITAPASSTDATYNGFDAFDVGVTNIDDETAGITVTPTMGLITNESGNEATFTVVLNSAPKNNVTVPIASSDTHEGTVGPAMLTFTPQNWKAPQEVTVTGVDDPIADGEKAYKVTVGPATSGDPSYNGVKGADVDVTNEDNDEPGFTLKPTSGLMTNEDGQMTTFTIVLNLRPTANVVVGLSSSNAAEGTVSPAMVTFTPDNWKAPQIVTVTGIDDSVADGNQVYNVITGAAKSDDPGYNNLDPPDIQAINVDNDSPGITAKPKTGLMTHENGMSTTFTLVLNSKPSGDVVLNLASSAPTEGNVTPKKATFTNANWNAPQTITITGVDDQTQDGNQPYSIGITLDPATADQAYAMLTGVDVSATNIDDDQAGILVQPQMGLVTSEKGASAAFTIVLTSRPTANVTIGLTSSATAEGIVSPASVTFTSANYNAPQTVTVKGVNDNVADGMQPYKIVTAAATSADPLYNGINPPDVSLTNTDDDSAGITIVPITSTTMPLTTTEGGGQATFTVVLNSQPKANVSMAFSSSKTSEGTVSPATITFTAVNWNAPQTITITGVNDQVADGNQPYTIVTAPSTSTDTAYNAIDTLDVQVVNTDNDTAGITVMPTTGLTTTEGGGQATFTVVLNSQPTANVTIALSSNKTAEGTVSPSSLTFTPANGKSPQTVTITGVDDAVADGNQPYAIIVGAAASTDAKYNAINPPDVAVTNTDNDSAGITVTPRTGLVTTEGGGQATFTVVLNSQPTANVTIALSSNKTTEGTVNPATLTFTAANYKSPQPVTVTGVNDDFADGNQPYSIVTAPATSTDAKYNMMDADDVSVTNTDNDSAGFTIMPMGITPTNPLITKEDGTKATFSIVLNSKPTGNVTIPLHSNNTAEGTISPASLVFTPADYNAATHVVTITGVDDNPPVQDGDVLFKILTDSTTSTDPNYNMKDPPDVDVKNVDNDTAGFTVTAADPILTKEDGTRATFTIVLNTRPAADVTVPIRSSNTAEGTVSPASLVFTNADWNSPHTVTVTGVDDSPPVQDGDQLYDVITDPATSTDANYNTKNPQDVHAKNVDNDTAGFTVTAANPIVTKETGTTATFTIVLNTRPAANVTIPIRSGNAAEGSVSPASLVFTPSDWNLANAAHTVTVTGVDDSPPVQDGDQLYDIITDPATSTDGNYNTKDPPDVHAKNEDNDSAGFSVSPTTIATTEGPGMNHTATFTIVLNTKPMGNVSIPITIPSASSGEATVSPSTLTFTPSDWNMAGVHTVTVTGVDDSVEDGLQLYTVVTGAATSPDGNYDGKDPQDVSGSNADNDSADIVVSPTNLTVSENPASPTHTQTFTIVLHSQPTAPVPISLTSSDGTQLTVSPTSFTFNASNWDMPQTFTVTGLDDDVAEGDKTYSIVINQSPASGDAKYAAINPDDVSVKVLDKTTAGIKFEPTTPVCQTTPTMTASFSIKLNSQPTASVSILVHSDTPAQGNVTAPVGGTVVLDGTNWNTGVTVTVTGFADGMPAGTTVNYTLITDPAVSLDPNYGGASPINPVDVSCTNTQ